MESTITDFNGFTPQRLEMTPAEWAQVPGNPRQRNTDARLARAKHLLNPSWDHRLVKMGILADGTRIKIDGHTRDLFWQRNPELAPPAIAVIVYPLRDRQHAMELYDHCDNAAALETASDKVFGAFREAGFQPVSPYMQGCRISAGLRLAHAIETHSREGDEVHQLTAHWLPELIWLDGISPNAAYFNSSILTAALLTLRKYRAIDFGAQDASGLRKYGGARGRINAETTREFWDRYNRNDGSKTGKVIDPIEALRKIVELGRDSHHLKASVYFTAGRAVACVERYLARKTYTTATSGGVMVKGMDLGKYFPTPERPAPAAEPPSSEPSGGAREAMSVALI